MENLSPEHTQAQLLLTGDGSHSLVWPQMDESYHSRHGAVRESRHVFLSEGLAHWQSQHPERTTVRILEVGFGTGLNAALALEASLRQPVLQVDFVSLEAFPVPLDLVQQLNYPNFLDSQARPYFLALHQADWNQWSIITPNFRLRKENSRLEDWHSDQKYDLVFFDAFAPKKQQEMWQLDLIQKTVVNLDTGGVWVSYCATGQLRRDLKTCGLIVERLPGPPGKREMTRGTKLD